MEYISNGMYIRLIRCIYAIRKSNVLYRQFHIQKKIIIFCCCCNQTHTHMYTTQPHAQILYRRHSGYPKRNRHTDVFHFFSFSSFHEKQNDMFTPCVHKLCVRIFYRESISERER